MKKYIAFVVLLVCFSWGARQWYEGLQVMGRVLAAEETEITLPAHIAVPAPRQLASVIPVESQVFSMEAPQPLGSDSPQGIAEQFVAERKSSWGIEPYHELRPTTYATPLGATVKYSVYQDGLPIVGMDIQVEVGNDRSAKVGQNSYRAVHKVETQGPTVNATEILGRMSGQYKLDERSLNGISRILYLAPGAIDPELAYVVPVQSKESGAPEQVIFRASDGQMMANQAARIEF